MKKYSWCIFKTLVFEKPGYAGDRGMEDIKWIDVKDTL